jgi:hypothetical protein
MRPALLVLAAAAAAPVQPGGSVGAMRLHRLRLVRGDAPALRRARQRLHRRDPGGHPARQAHAPLPDARRRRRRHDVTFTLLVD